jgi:hypothetical protein
MDKKLTFATPRVLIGATLPHNVNLQQRAPCS